MSQLSTIPNPTPIVKEAVPERVFDKQFCTQILIQAKPGEPWSAMFVGHAYDGTSIDQDDMQVVQLENLLAISQKDPHVASAMRMVLNVVGKYLVKCKMKNTPKVNADNVQEILK
jgi:hypothetical protein